MVNTRHRSENRSEAAFLSNEDFDRKHAAHCEESDESSGVVDFSPRSLRKSTSRKKTGAATRRRFVIDDDDPTDEENNIDSHQKPSVKSSLHRCHPMVEGKEEVAVRRSSRQRKLLYGTFDPKILERALYVDKQSYEHEDDNPRKKRRVEETNGVDIEDMEESMYSRVKRVRKPVKRDMYGMPVHESSESESSEDENGEDGDEEDNENNEEDEDDEDEEEDDDEEEKKSDKSQRRSYYLREHKPRTQLFEVPIEERRRRKPTIFAETPDSPVRRKKHSPVYRSPAHRRVNLRRKRAFHGNSSTSSSSSGSSSDEGHFQRRKAKSMARARNQLLPMNLADKDMIGTMKDRQRIGASLADVDPMTIDKSVTFSSVGGLDKHIRALKEMVVFPLLYSEVFERFKIAPPRGCLFYGPPGTGKTLVARALANECSKGDKRVAFFMRKGADCLSKWVGESERQLRLLFDQAYQMRPSIIFFDEIDGLAPVRSSRQDQIHSSIVSTLLALMDGLDNRGEIIVIGATNRIDSIDPALRRPGRFDREFLFPLPSKEARRQILSIHTKDWNPRLLPQFINSVADLCVGYCGADLKALCTEAALLALRRRYPQIYQSSEKLQIDVSSICVSAQDFQLAMQSIVPASQRCVASPGKALSCHIQPLLQNVLLSALETLHKVFPISIAQASTQDPKSQTQGLDDEWTDDENHEGLTIYEGKRRNRVTDEEFMQNLISFSSKKPCLYRPRLILEGAAGRGQTAHLGPALLHHLEHLSVHLLDLSTMFCVSTRTPEEACAHVFREAMRSAPCIVYMPRMNQWWDVLSESMRTTLLTTIQNLDPSSAILLLATSEEPLKQLDPWVQGIFGQQTGEVIHVGNPSKEERREFFQDLLLNQTVKIKTVRKTRARDLEILPKAPPPVPRKLTDKELKTLRDKEESTLRELRIFLREVVNKVVKDRKFYIFARPVDVEEVPDYYEVISNPMDLSTMMSKIDMHQYQTGKEFLSDVDLICSNALEYNPNRDTASRAIRHRACALRDTFHAIIGTELDPEFEKQCEEIAESRKNRGETETHNVPAFYITKSMVANQERYSRRVRGLDIEPHKELEEVEKKWSGEKRKKSPVKNNDQEGEGSSKDHPIDIQITTSPKMKPRTALFTKASFAVTPKKPKRREVWSYTKRKKYRRFGRYSLPALKPQVKKRFIPKSSPDEVSLPHSESLKVDVTEPEGIKSSKSPRSPVQISPFSKPVKALSPRQLSSVSDRGEKVQESVTVNTDEAPKAMEVDSGVSSSVDSNGDSVDSVEQAKQLAKQKLLSVEIVPLEIPIEKEAPVVIQKTEPDRSTKTEVSKEALEQLLDKVVTFTEGFNVERLQKLYSVFSQCIIRHRDNQNKTGVLQELQTLAEKSCTSS